MKSDTGKAYTPQSNGLFSRLFYLAASLLIGVLLWHAATLVFGLPAFILPGPGQVWRRFLQSLTEGQLQQHALTTLFEVLAGLLIGGLAATSLGYLLAKSALLEKLLSPYLVASQSLPVVAIAPLLIIWFGPGIFSKILICSLTVFFPILINTVVGLREVPNPVEIRGSRSTADLHGRFARWRHPVCDWRGRRRTGRLGSRPGVPDQHRARSI